MKGMKLMDKKTERILKHDSLAETEKEFGGKHHSEFNRNESILAIGNFMRDNAIKEKHLKSLNDTYFGMGWNEFIELIKSQGFNLAYVQNFEHNKGIDEAVIYYNPFMGLVIYAESYNNKTSINGGKLHGEIVAHSESDYMPIYDWLSTGGCIDRDKLIFSTSHDIREGLFSKIDKLCEHGSFLTKWTEENKFLWFVHFTEKKKKGYDYIELTQQKLDQCCEELRNIIGR